MSNVTLNDLNSSFGSQVLLNENFTTIENALNNDVLYRTGIQVNAMQRDFDMNSKQILNLKAGVNSSDAANLGQVLAQGVFTVAAADARFVESMALAQADTTLVVADVLVVHDRYSSVWDVVLTSGVTPDTYSIVQSIALPTISFVLRSVGTGNVREFGAAGNGSTDDTAVFNATTAYINAQGGGNVYVPVGVYIISDIGSVANIGDETSIKMYPNVHIVGESKTKSELKMVDGATGSVAVIRMQGGSLISWGANTIENASVSNLTINGNRSNHTRTIVTDGVTTAGSNIVTSASAPFTAAMVSGAGRRFLFVDRARSSFDITNIAASGSNTVITAIGHDFRVGELIQCANITGSGDVSAMNNQAFAVTSVLTHLDGQVQTATVVHTISSGSYTSGGIVAGGILPATIDGFTNSSTVTISSNAPVTTTGNNFSIEEVSTSYGVLISGAHHCDVSGCIIKDAFGDGIYVEDGLGLDTSGKCTDIKIRKNYITGNRRQGVSLISVDDYEISGNTIKDTGIDGVGPGSAIDLEPNEGAVANGSITNNILTDNVGAGISLSKIFTDTSGTPLIPEATYPTGVYGTGNVRIAHNQILRNHSSGVQCGGFNEGVVIENNNIEFNRRNGIRVIGMGTGKLTQQFKILNNNIRWNQFFKGDDGDIDAVANGHGIVFHNAASNIRMQNILIAGNTVEYNDGHGYYTTGLICDYLNILNNIAFEGNGQRLHNTYSNIKVDGTDVNGLQIRGNRVGRGSTSVSTHPYGVTTGYINSKTGIEVNISGDYDALIENNDVQSAGITNNILIVNHRNVTGGARVTTRNNPGYKTECSVFSSNLNSATTNAANSAQTVNIAHTLAITPLARHISLTMDGSTLTTSPIMHCPPYISAVDGTNVTVSYSIGTGGVGNFIVNLDIRGDNFL